MSDVKCIVEAAARLRRAGEPFLVATVVRVRGSSYRRPGARMLLTQERWVAGSVSGGCLEGDVVRKGWWHTREGAPALVTYDSTAQDEVRWGFGLGCDGVVDVLLERGGQQGRIDPLAFLERCLGAHERGALATVFQSEVPGVPVGARVAVRAGEIEADQGVGPLLERVAADARAVLGSGESAVLSYECAGGTAAVFIEAVVPPARLFVFGAGHDAVAVVQLARTVGWEVIVCEPHGRWATRERFAMADEILFASPAQAAVRVDASDRAMAIVMAHNYEQDRACLAMLLGTRARYIGVLGPRRRTARMLAEIAEEQGGAGLDFVQDERIHAPVGLSLGAESPAEIALSMIAEVQQVLARAPASSLRERRGPIHAGSAAAG